MSISWQLGIWAIVSKVKILVCTKGKHCRKRGGKDVACALAKQLECLGVDDKFSIKKSECLGRCERGPAVKVKDLELSYGRVEPEDCKDLVKEMVKVRKAIKR